MCASIHDMDPLFQLFSKNSTAQHRAHVFKLIDGEQSRSCNSGFTNRSTDFESHWGAPLQLYRSTSNHSPCHRKWRRLRMMPPAFGRATKRHGEFRTAWSAPLQTVRPVALQKACRALSSHCHIRGDALIMDIPRRIESQSRQRCPIACTLLSKEAQSRATLGATLGTVTPTK